MGHPAHGILGWKPKSGEGTGLPGGHRQPLARGRSQASFQGCLLPITVHWEDSCTEEANGSPGPGANARTGRGGMASFSLSLLGQSLSCQDTTAQNLPKTAHHISWQSI